MCPLTTFRITATPGTCSHPKTPWIRQFEFVTYMKNSTPYQPLTLFKAHFCSTHWSIRTPIGELGKYRDKWFIIQSFPPTRGNLWLKRRISCTIGAHKATWCNRGASLRPLSGHVLANSNLYVQMQCPCFLSKYSEFYRGGR